MVCQVEWIPRTPVLTGAFVWVSQEDYRKGGSSEQIVHREQRHGARAQGEDTKRESGAHGDLLFAFYFLLNCK